MIEIKKNILPLLLCLSIGLQAQNTIGGVKTTVPESEVKRQSAFLNAEKERLLGHWEKAKEAYKTFLFENEDADAAWYGLARTYAALNDMVNASDAISKAIAKDPQNQWYLLYQADLFEKAGRNKDAMGSYETLVERFPNTHEFYEKLAYFYVLNEEPKKAIKVLDKLEKLTGITEANTDKKHLIYVGLGNNKKAAEEYEKLADAYPERVKYRYKLADFYERIGDSKNAQKTWEDIARRFPDDPMAKISLASTQGGTDAQYLASIRPLFSDPGVSIDAKVKELVPFLGKMEGNKDPETNKNLLALGEILTTTHPDEAKAWSVAGDMLYLDNQSAEALSRYKKCIELNPGVFSVWDNSLSILIDQKQYAEAEKLADQSLDYFPNQPKAYLQFAIASVALRHYDKAISNLNQALLMTGNNPLLKAEILELLGDAQMGKNDKAKAKDSWKQAYEISKNPAIQEKVSRIQ